MRVVRKVRRLTQILEWCTSHLSMGLNSTEIYIYIYI